MPPSDAASALIAHVSELPTYAPPAHRGTQNRRLVEASFGAGFEMILGSIAPGGEASRHYHADAAQVFYIVAGEALVSLGDEPARRCGKGTIVRIPKGLVHEIVAAGAGPLEIIVLYAPPLAPGAFVEVPR